MANRTIVFRDDNTTLFLTPVAPLSLIPPVVVTPPTSATPQQVGSPSAQIITPETTPLTDNGITGPNLAVLLPAIVVPAGAVIIAVIIFAILYTRYKAKQHGRRMAVLNPMQSKL